MRKVTTVTWVDEDNFVRHTKFDVGGYTQPAFYDGYIHLSSFPEKAVADFVQTKLLEGLVDTIFINQCDI